MSVMEKLDKSVDKYEKSKAKTERLREQVITDINTAADDGESQLGLSNHTGYSRGTIRQWLGK